MFYPGGYRFMPKPEADEESPYILMAVCSLKEKQISGSGQRHFRADYKRRRGIERSNKGTLLEYLGG
ncbi:hypothetical protein DPMN_006546 [Dreissena polymorpha]|uniref:Uncharacterized protein n=1 Tax=Dreissena polymorpha TaxID=45954 RepID=A0A9D4MVI9_DREPO|nr:hypothetical protein DPMN_006546 [Dreissena polymorpha]